MEPAHPLHVVIRARTGLRLRRRAGWRAVQHGLVVTARRRAFRICHVSIQANHLHLVVEAHDRVALARGMQGFQVATARRYNGLMQRRGGVFLDRYHPVPLRGPRHVRNGVAYVLGNWRRHGEDREHGEARLDPYSSAAAFPGWIGEATFIRLAPGEELLPVRMPETWLLRVGWRLHGPLSPRARPGPGAVTGS